MSAPEPAKPDPPDRLDAFGWLVGIAVIVALVVLYLIFGKYLRPSG
jgi:hypothetical protein